MTATVYLNGQYLPEEEARISVNDRGFMFADGTYDVLRSISGVLFHGDEHFQRLAYCLKELEIRNTHMDEIRNIIYKLLEINHLSNQEASVYLQITRGVYRRMHAFPDADISPTVYIAVRKFTPFEKEFSEGVKCITAEDIRWQRCDLKTIGLVANVMAIEKASRSGAYEAIFIRNGLVTEASHSSVFGVFNGKVLTHPKNNHILAGISRDIVIDLCRKLHIDFEEKPIKAEQLPHLEELMVVGTSTEVMPVVRLDNYSIADGKPGKITAQLHQEFRKYMNEYVKHHRQGKNSIS